MIYLKDYKCPNFLIDEVFLHFDLAEDVTHVKSILHLKRHPESGANTPLVLAGEKLTLVDVLLDGKTLSKDCYTVEAHQLIIRDVPEAFILETEVRIKPHENFSGCGLYYVKGNYCTQCESHGFRRITYYLDRPDVLSRFTTTIVADKKRYPCLLSNGNLVDKKDLNDGRHWVKWEDPSLKPCYLFALVAGDYDCLADNITTYRGRRVQLKLYVEKGKLVQSHHAMSCLKRAMRWDEENFNREYDLDIYMIVAVSTFNMGAMENKGLNIFNDKYILAQPKTATDTDYINIESVIGHEYFHNWSGNRVTVRDWFQITLKEGLTIFRDQSFTADMTSSAVKRIQDVSIIRTQQFLQDAGPMSHPIRPDHYMEVNNFYTVTVYHKGAEVIRMLQTILGKEKFKEAMDLYFSRYDGKAVTTENFVQAMEDVSGIDLTHFRLWYSQAGTPVLTVTDHYEPEKRIYYLTVQQACAPTPDQTEKQPLHIPFAVGLLDKDGSDILPEITRILTVNKAEQTFYFENIEAKPIPSLLRDFSAPVKLEFNYHFKDLFFLLQHDSDPYNRWNAGQELARQSIIKLINLYQENQPLVCDAYLSQAFELLLQNKTLEETFVAELLTLPSEAFLIETMKIANVDAVHITRTWLKTTIANDIRELFMFYYQQLNDRHYVFDRKACGRRKLKNLCLSYLTLINDQKYLELVKKQYQTADNMTDTMGALSAINQIDSQLRIELLDDFYRRWTTESLVVDKWLSLHAMAPVANALTQVKTLLHHEAFDLKNPNKVRALIDTFCRMNHINFHAKNGSGYQFLAEQVIAIDQFNPQVAARSLEPLTHWKRYDLERQQLMKTQLEWIERSNSLSKDVYEIVSKSLQAEICDEQSL